MKEEERKRERKESKRETAMIEREREGERGVREREGEWRWIHGVWLALSGENTVGLKPWEYASREIDR